MDGYRFFHIIICLLFSTCSAYTVHDIVSMVENGDFESADIFLTPPGDGQCSDEDDADEDTEGRSQSGTPCECLYHEAQII